jgi:hypothetical protein
VEKTPGRDAAFVVTGLVDVLPESGG